MSNNEVIEVLDHGYVSIPWDAEQDRLLILGSDHSIVNAARASFQKQSKKWDERDDKLLRWLMKENETSPFRHALITFEVKAPLFVARQWWKYIVGSDHNMDGWNEASRRYVTLDPEFYTPNKHEWRSQPANKKQGSGQVLDEITGTLLEVKLATRQKQSLQDYQDAMDLYNVAAEEARLFLLAYGMYVSWRWTASLNSICHLINQRLHHKAQHEFQLYAQALVDLVKPHFPTTIDALVKETK